MSNIKSRAGSVKVRVGGNTQDYAYMAPYGSLPNNSMIVKDKTSLTNPTETPTLIFTDELLYLLNNVTGLVNVKWYLGVPFNDTNNLRLQIVEDANRILGDNLLGMQAANEPDLYADHGHRATTYSPFDYYGEFGTLVNAYNADSSITVKNNLIAPNVAGGGGWTPEMVWDTGFLSTYDSSLAFLAVEHYPDDNCFAVFGIGAPKDPQTEFSNYLNHTAPQLLVQPYLNSTNIAQQNGKPFLMFETNTASCGGFPGLSDSFGAALWAVDYGLQMAYSNFSGALLHVGGQSDFYNPFSPPPTNQSTFRQWTVAPLYYAVLAVAETFGPSGNAQIVDLFMNSNNIYTPGYAIYENGAPVRMAFINYLTDASGASSYTATINFEGGTVPSSVKVKYLLAPSVAEKQNVTWAGQTFGNFLSSDGRLQGSESIQTVNCDTTNNACAINVPAPSFALVFLTDSAFSESEPTATQTFSTTSVTKTVNTATVNPSVLATSNGHGGMDGAEVLGSTSKGSASSGGVARAGVSGIVALGAAAIGAWLVGRAAR